MVRLRSQLGCEMAHIAAEIEILPWVAPRFSNVGTSALFRKYLDVRLEPAMRTKADVHRPI
jgi:hypothetical protein